MTNTYTAQDLQAQIKPLSSNGFIAFWQNLWRKWLGVWYGFAEKHPTASKWIYQLVFFIVFSQGVTIWQLLVMLFLPYAFEGIWDVPFVWPAAALPWTDYLGNALNYAIFNEPVKFLTETMVDGKLTEVVVLASNAEQVKAYLADPAYALQMSGLGNFIAFEIAVFTAQCINLPLQRNITFKSKGNIWVQALAYFIGWVGISIGVNALWGIINPILLWWNWPEFLIALLKTFITGGISMAIFFPIFLIIFPDRIKAAASKKKKYESLVAANAPAEQIEAAKAAYEEAQKVADIFVAENELTKASSIASTAAIKYFALAKSAEEAEGEEKATLEANANEAFEVACKAIEEKAAKEAALADVNA